MSLYKYAIQNNVWLWFHILAGGLLAKIFYSLAVKYIRKYDAKQLTFLSILFIAVLWEVFEYSSGIGAYPGLREFLLDSLGDVVGALIMAVIVLL